MNFIIGKREPSLMDREMANQAKVAGDAAMAIAIKQAAAERELADKLFAAWRNRREAQDNFDRTSKLLSSAIRQRDEAQFCRENYLEDGGTDAGMLATLRGREIASSDIIEHAERAHRKSVTALEAAEKAHLEATEAQRRGVIVEAPAVTETPAVAAKPAPTKKAPR